MLSLIRDGGHCPSGELASVHSLLAADLKELWTGVYDHNFASIAATPDKTLGASWFTSILRARETEHSRELAARGSIVVGDAYPDLAQSWREIGKRVNKSMAVKSSFWSE